MEKNKIKVVHIHTDAKFIFAGHSFHNENVQNVTIFFGLTDKAKFDFEFERYQCSTKKSDIEWLIKYCSDAEYVVLWGLSPLNIYLATKIHKNIKKIWRLFGAEVYRLHKNVFLSEKSQKLDQEEEIGFLLNLGSTLKSLIKGRISVPQIGLVNVLDKIDFVMGLAADEYLLLKRLFPNLPPFLQAPDWPINDYAFQPSFAKRYKIVIGISKEIWNNYLDILEPICVEKGYDIYTFEVLFNYGTENQYTNKIRNVVDGRKNIILIEDFMDKDEFTQYFNHTLALVVNSYRQCGMGSIFSALRAGVKVYLNTRNVMYTWLCKEGFKIHPIEMFFATLQNNSLKYNFAEAMHNANNFKNLSQRYSIEKFQEEIFKDILAINDK